MMGLPTVIQGAANVPVYSERFQEDFSKLRDPVLRKRIATLVARICHAPNHPRDHLGQNKDGMDWRGKRDRHAGGNTVVMFSHCGECKKEGFHCRGFNECCEDPALTPCNIVRFFVFGTHKQVFGREIN
jgi:hypothetical protein